MMTITIPRTGPLGPIDVGVLPAQEAIKLQKAMDDVWNQDMIYSGHLALIAQTLLNFASQASQYAQDMRKADTTPMSTRDRALHLKQILAYEEKATAFRQLTLLYQRAEAEIVTALAHFSLVTEALRYTPTRPSLKSSHEERATGRSSRRSPEG